jgi:hypothetical protein
LRTTSSAPRATSSAFDAPSSKKEKAMPKSSPAKLAYQRAYNARPENVKKREENNAARAKLMREGKVHVGDGKDVAHLKSLENGGTNTRGNLAVQSTKKNRGWRRGSGTYNPDK